MSLPVVSVRNVTKRFILPLDKSATLKHRIVHLRSSSRYRELLALEDISFEVGEGEFVGIIGRNGSGKSTLLKILARIFQPSSGTVQINGALSPFLELGVGFNPELTARENILLSGSIIGLQRRDLEARMDEMIHFAELEQFVDTKLKNYSSGMQVRLAFTVAIQANAAILLMDEVLAVGDARFQAKCFDIFNSYKKQGRTIILVTHDMSAVDLYADRAIMLEHGRMVADGPPSDVTAGYRQMIGRLEEEERIASGGALVDIADMTPRDGRWGDGTVRITSVRFLRGDGTKHVTFTTGEPMLVEIEIEAHKDVGNLTVGLHMHRGDGSVVGGMNTKLQHCLIPPLRKGDRITVEYAMPSLRIVGGTYRLTVDAVELESATTYDWMEQAFEFRVIDEMALPGLVELGGTFVLRRHDTDEIPPAISRSDGQGAERSLSAVDALQGVEKRPRRA